MATDREVVTAQEGRGLYGSIFTLFAIVLICSFLYGGYMLLSVTGSSSSLEVVYEKLPRVTGTGEVAGATAAKMYVASKSGTRYYYPWCSGVRRIKESNKVWFSTKEEAEAKGLTPAKNCRGL